MFIQRLQQRWFFFYSKQNVQHAGAADLFSMNYFLLRLTPTATERLTRGRAWAVGSAQQSCLIRRTPPDCRETAEEEIHLLAKNQPLFQLLVLWLASWWSCWHFYLKLVLKFSFLNLPSMRQRGQQDTRGVQLWWCAVSGLILHFAGHSFNTPDAGHFGDVNAGKPL